ncbi:MAG: hypothetical protein K2I06_02990 [Ruminococcus sp.]|nr:hypothetical protein [Ruminococcus sp.]
MTYIFNIDNEYTENEWDISSETETQKNISLHLNYYLKGDVNGDNLTDAVDATQIQQYYAKLSANGEVTFNERQLMAADVNHDDLVDAVDATQIQQYYAKLSALGHATWPNEENKTVDYSSYEDAVNMLGSIQDNIITFRNYYIYDINSDGIYELITEMGTDKADNEYSVYSIKNDEMIFVGDIDADYSTLVEKDGKLYKDYRQDTQQKVELISFDGEKISAETVYNEDSKIFIDYGTALNTYDWSDKAGIDSITNKNTDVTTTTTTATTTTTTTTTTTNTTTTEETTTPAITTTVITNTVLPQEVHIYRTKSGKKYHYENPCGNGTYYEVTLEEALSAGLEPCEKCVLH